MPAPRWGRPQWNGIRPSYQRDRNYREPPFIDCASVSPSVRCVSPIVRRTRLSVSRNLRRKRRSIARRTVYHCAPLHIATPAGKPCRGYRATGIRHPEARAERRSGATRAGRSPEGAPQAQVHFCGHPASRTVPAAPSNETNEAAGASRPPPWCLTRRRRVGRPRIGG